MNKKVPVSLVEVPAARAGQKLARFLEVETRAPRGAVMRWIRTGQARVDGSRAKPFDVLAAGAVVRVPPHEPAQSPGPAPGEAARGGLVIAADDGVVLFVAKPAGLPVHPGSGHTDSVQTRLAAMYAQAQFVPAPAHRLDRDTTGLLAAGRTHAAQAGLSAAFRDRRARKTYLAWVDQEMAGRDRITMQDELSRKGAPGRERMGAARGGRDAAPALAHVRPLEVRRVNGRPRTLVEVELLTGRTHQIRVQLALRGHPVAGDRKYGRGGSDGAPGLMLHAWRLEVLDRRARLDPDWTGDWRCVNLPGKED